MSAKEVKKLEGKLREVEDKLKKKKVEVRYWEEYEEKWKVFGSMEERS